MTKAQAAWFRAARTAIRSMTEDQLWAIVGGSPSRLIDLAIEELTRRGK